jgi:hypothetical protein
LCKALGITEADFDSALDLPEEEKYTPKEILKKNGKVRIVYKPNVQIRKIQRRIKNRFFVITGRVICTAAFGISHLHRSSFSIAII